MPERYVFTSHLTEIRMNALISLTLEKQIKISTIICTGRSFVCMSASVLHLVLQRPETEQKNVK